MSSPIDPTGGPWGPPPVATAGPDPGGSARRGRGLVTAGVIVLALSIVIGLGGTLFAMSRLDVGQFERDVVLEGPERALLPGELRFRIVEPIGAGRSADMTVGVAVSDTAAPPLDCSLSAEDAAPIRLELATSGTELIRATDDAYTVVQQAELGPGDYTLSCSFEGEPSGGRGANFTVGRVIGTDDALGLIGPALLLFAAIGVGSVAFIVGLILLVVGIVRGRRPSPGAPPPGSPPGSWSPPPSQWPPGA